MAARSSRCAALERRDPALVDVPHALEGLAEGSQPDQGSEALLVVRVLEGLAASEHVGQVGAVHVGRQDEVDEAALVAPPAPPGEALVRVLVEGTVAAAKGVVVAGQPGEPLGHPQFGAGPEIGEDGELGAQGSRHELGEAALELVALGPLVVHRVPVGYQRRGRRRPLVGEHDGVASFEHRGDDGGGRDDGGDRHMPVEEPQLDRAAHQWVDGAGDADHGQPGHRSRALNGGEGVVRWVDHAQRGAGVVGREGFDGDDGVDPAAEGDQRAARLGLVAHGRRGGGVGTSHLEAAQVDAVAVGELTEPVGVVLGQEGALGRSRGEIAEVDHRGGRRLVVRHARQQEQDAHGGLHGRVVPVPTRPEGEAFREGVRGGRVTAGHRGPARVDGDAVVAEVVGRRHAGERCPDAGRPHATAPPVPRRPHEKDQSSNRTRSPNLPQGRVARSLNRDSSAVVSPQSAMCVARRPLRTSC